MKLRLFRSIWTPLLVGTVFVASLLPLGCGGGGDGGSIGSGRGTLQVFMADGTDPTVLAVEVDISRVEAHIGNSWEVLSTTPQTLDLFSVKFTEALIAQAGLPAGHYNQIRFIVDECRVTDSEGTHIANIPSGSQTGIKVNLNFTVPPNDITGVLLDFNVHRSLRRLGNGNYQLRPVVAGVVRILSGTVTGIATDGAAPLAGAVIRAIYKSGPHFPVDTEVNSTTSVEDGRFKVWALMPGTYELQLTWTDPINPLIVRTATVNGVVVTANANTDVGRVTLALAAGPP